MKIITLLICTFIPTFLFSQTQYSELKVERESYRNKANYALKMGKFHFSKRHVDLSKDYFKIAYEQKIKGAKQYYINALLLNKDFHQAKLLIDQLAVGSIDKLEFKSSYHAEKGMLEKAISLYKELLNKKVDKVSTYIDLVTSHILLNNVDSAKYYLDQIQYDAKNPVYNSIIKNLNLWYYSKTKQYNKLDSLKDIKIISLPGLIAKNTFLSVGKSKGDYKEFLDFTNATFEMIDSFRTKTEIPFRVKSFNQIERDYYDHLVDFFYEKGDYEKVFEVFQVAKCYKLINEEITCEERSLLNKINELEGIEKTFAKEDLLYFRKKRTVKKIKRINLTTFRKNLKGSALDYLMVSKDKALVLHVTKEKLEVKTITLKGIKNFMNYLNNPAIGNYDSFVLYETLLPFDLKKDLLISPDFTLRYLPFEALKKERYLIENHNISYIPSFSLLNIDKQKSLDVIAFAPSFVNRTRHLITHRSTFDTLLYNVPEVKEITPNNTIGTINKQEVLEAFEKSNIVHIATHAAISEQSFIALSNDSISYEEIKNRSFKNDMVVLSACQTGYMETGLGDNSKSMSRAFISAGAKSVVSTLWKVDDKSTSELMIDFYKELSQGKNKDQALRQAKLKMIDKHPYYWAGVKLEGNTKAFKVSNINTYLLNFLFLVVAIMAFRLKKRMFQQSDLSKIGS